MSRPAKVLPYFEGWSISDKISRRFVKGEAAKVEIPQPYPPSGEQYQTPKRQLFSANDGPRKNHRVSIIDGRSQGNMMGL